MALKRTMDVVLGTIFSVLALPVILGFALVLIVRLRTWPFFIQQRVGRDGRLFRLAKLRTLPRSIGTYACKYTFADAKLPFLCRFLRTSHLDELPQLLLVPLGRMSLVGPRPKMPDWAEPIDQAYSAARTRVRPGCTGLWQVSNDTGRRVTDCPDYDYFYLRNACFRLDLWIIWRTVLLFLGLSGGVSLPEVPQWACRSPTPWPMALARARSEHPAGWLARENRRFGRPSGLRR